MNTSHPGDAAPSADEIRAELARVLAGSALRSAPQMSAFLTYVVEETLAGRGGNLKGYNVAVEALGRGSDFDPVADPIVRVEANRLRRALDTHYAGDGAGSGMRIVLERGSYAPRFVRIDRPSAAALAVTPPLEASAPTPSSPEPAAKDGNTAEKSARDTAKGTARGTAGANASPAPIVAARPRSGMGGWIGAALVMVLGLGVAALSLRLIQPPAPPVDRAAGAAGPAAQIGQVAPVRLPLVRLQPMASPTERENAANEQFSMMLSDALSRFDEFIVIDEPARPSAATERADQPVYVIEHRARESAGSVYAVLRMLDSRTGRIVWSGSLEEDANRLDSIQDIREVARRVAVRLAQPYGVLHAELRDRADLSPAMRCLVDTYDYWRNPSESAHAEVRACLEAALKRHPNFHQGWALLAMITLDEHRIGFNPRPDPPLARARAAARTANELAPESARAAQALMAVNTVGGDIDAGIRIGYQAVRRNPFDTDILADLGARLAQAGRPQEGRPLLIRAAEVNLARPAWHEFYLFLTARFAGDRDAMRSALQALAGSEAPLALLAQVIAASDAGQIEAGRQLSNRLAAISPVYAKSPGAFLDRAHFAPSVRADLIQAIAQVIVAEDSLTAPARLP